MKYLPIILLLISCGAKEPKFKPKPSVTTNTTIQFTVNHLTNQHIITNVDRVVQDTFDFMAIDSTTQRKQWRRDTFYYFIQIDSLRDGAGKAQFDTTGRALFQQRSVPLKKEHVLVDYNKNWPRQ